MTECIVSHDDDDRKIYDEVFFDDGPLEPLTETATVDDVFRVVAEKPKSGLSRLKEQFKRFQEGKQTRKTKGTPPPIMATDSEWDTSLPQSWLSTTFADADTTTVFIRDDLPGDIKERLNAEATRIGVRLVFTARTDDTNLLALLDVSKARLLNYWSPKDFEYALGWTAWNKAILNRKVRQRNNLSGKIGHIHLKDLSGWAGKTSLKRFAASLGYPMAHKSSLDDYKTCMHQALLELPEEFLHYAGDDARLLVTLYDTFVFRARALQEESLNMRSDDLWTAETIPMTTGALTARTFERWIHSQAGDSRRALKLALRKLGILDQDAKNYEKNRKAHDYLTARYRTVTALDTTNDRSTFELLDHASYQYTALGGASIKRWLTMPTTETGCFNALVQGGRCNNEMPFDYALDKGMDVDISSCYGESLRTLTFPIGLPTVWSYAANEPRITLGSWYDRNINDLVDGLWTCTVSGSLRFDQDLIYSKLVKVRDIQTAANKDPDEVQGIDGDFQLLRREIKNGIITADVWNTLRKVCTHTEWKEIRQLQVVTAAAYLQRDRKADVADWCAHVLKDAGAFKNTDKVGHRPQDMRSRAWYSIPLERFIGRLVEERKQHKACAKNTSLSDAERQHSAGMDGMLKLFVNTLYGVLASPFFTIGNTVVANNITAKARVGVWMVAKALGLRQCITDGGMYAPAAVPIFGSKRPGLDILSRMWDWTADARYQRRLIPLFVGDVPADVDALAMAHLTRFWDAYRLPFLYHLEHKLDNTFHRAAYWSKGDYALDTAAGRKYALRGKDRNRRTGNNRHPLFDIMDAILDGRNDFPAADLTYTRGGILKIGKYRIIQASEGYTAMKDLRPGDNLPERTYPVRLNNAWMPLATEQEYRNRRNRKKTNHGQPSPWFERFGTDGIDTVHRKMIRDTLR